MPSYSYKFPVGTLTVDGHECEIFEPELVRWPYFKSGEFGSGVHTSFRFARFARTYPEALAFLRCHWDDHSGIDLRAILFGYNPKGPYGFAAKEVFWDVTMKGCRLINGWDWKFLVDETVITTPELAKSESALP